MVGFKEWAVVCEALGDGTTSLILRKGGIAEGREGFRFQHPFFFLMPTFFHEQLAKTRLSADARLPEPTPGEIQIQFAAQVVWTRLVTNRDLLEKIAPWHILQPSVVEDRFQYDDTLGINVAFLRVWRLQTVWNFPDAPRYGGCRSWVNLPEISPDLSCTPVLDEDASQARSEELSRLLDL